MTSRISKVVLYPFLAALMLLGACQEPGDEGLVKTKYNLTGYVQKGPYINGSTITIFELDTDLVQTGNTFGTVVNDNNTGSFELEGISLGTSLVEFQANGFYFNEVSGDISVAPLTLWALSDIQDKTSVNVNILTHFERERVRFLVASDSSFADAKRQAFSEVLAIFGFEGETENSELLDISQAGDNNAILLAISVIVQGNRSIGEVSELLANISADIKEDGVLDNMSIKGDLDTKAAELSLIDIRQNIEDRYESIGLDVTVPDFESYVNIFIGESTNGIVTDIDGNEYRTVKLGGQWWMSENLKTTRYANGDLMVNGTAVDNHAGDVVTRYYFVSPYPPPSTIEVPEYGYYYTYAAVMHGESVSNNVPSGVQGACPADWHVPSTAEFNVLKDYLSSSGSGLETSAAFDLHLAGIRGYDFASYAVVESNYAFWPADGADIGTGPCCHLEAGKSVRCVKD